MVQFIVLLLSIVIMSALMVAGANYIQPSAMARSEFRDKITASMQSASIAYRAYKTSNRTLPAVSASITDFTPWQNNFANYAPSAVSVKYDATNIGQPLFYKDTTYGANFCFVLAGLTEAQYNGLVEAANNFPVDQTVTPNQKTVVLGNAACGIRSDDPSAAAPASWPGTVYVTLWLDYANAL